MLTAPAVPRVTGRLASLLDAGAWRQRMTTARARYFDWRHGIETCRPLAVESMRDVPADAARHAVHYEPTNLLKFERAMAALNLDPPGCTFIDYGSGKGRVLLLAAAWPFRRIVGVEFSPELHAAAEANVAAFSRSTGRLPPIECRCLNALEYQPPTGDLVAYFYNPFDANILAPVVQRLLESDTAGERRVMAIYVNPMHRCVFEASGRWRLLVEDPALMVYQCGPGRPPAH